MVKTILVQSTYYWRTNIDSFARLVMPRLWEYKVLFISMEKRSSYLKSEYWLNTIRWCIFVFFRSNTLLLQGYKILFTPNWNKISNYFLDIQGQNACLIQDKGQTVVDSRLNEWKELENNFNSIQMSNEFIKTLFASAGKAICASFLLDLERILGSFWQLTSILASWIYSKNNKSIILITTKLSVLIGLIF